MLAPSPAPAPLPFPWKALGLVLVGLALATWASPQTALLAGIATALLPGDPLGAWSHRASKWLLQASVVALGFSLDLKSLLRLGLHGSLFALATIAGALVLGLALGRRLGLSQRLSLLIASGTAICGGSAIAAVSMVIGASEAEIAISIGTVFLLNAVALYLFPFVGHQLGLSQTAFGLWAGIAIHDISSVVGAALSYGPQALATATAVKLARTLWIVPLTLVLALRPSWGGAVEAAAPTAGAPRRATVTIPWFIGLFLAASWSRNASPAVAAHAPELAALAGRVMVLVLFLIGHSLNHAKLKAVGWRTLGLGLALWSLISLGTLWMVLALR